MTALIFALPGNEFLAEKLQTALPAHPGALSMRSFPDGETYVRVESDCAGQEVIVVASLDRPDDKIIPLLFLADTLRDLGATRVGLVAPYLAYMRQDRRFLAGEGITSRYFARLLSQHVDWLVTVDPHLHRYRSLDEIYTIPTRVLSAAPLLALWLREHLTDFILIGPDSESEQWVSQVAQMAGAPFIILHKDRHGDRDVTVSTPDVERWRHYTPVLVDDIISSARTMIETMTHLKAAGMKPPVCIGVHGVFAPGAYEALAATGAARIITSTTVPHHSNDIDVSAGLAQEIRTLL